MGLSLGSVMAVGAARYRCICDLIQDCTGIVVSSRDQGLLSQYIQARMRDLGFECEAQYCDFLRPDDRSHDCSEEWTHLLRRITNGESYFFRDPDQLQLISDTLLPELIERRRKLMREGLIDHLYLNLWSAGCSTGEEPYSLAIMLKALLPDFADWRIHLIATDINPEAIASAKTGRYRDWSLRQIDPRYKHQYFRKLSRDWQIDADLQPLVQWDVLNLTQPNAIARRIPWASMDLILCRNVFIYFERSAVTRALQGFHSALNHDGYLVVGHAELEGQDLSQFALRQTQGSVFYQRAPIDKTGIPA